MLALAAHVTPFLSPLVISDPVITPTPTPELSPVAADLPAAPLTPPPPEAEDAEVQLVERSAEERASAAVEEAPPAPENRAASHCSSTEDSSSSTSSSSTTVGTEATYKAVSEGELLSHVQLGDTMTGTITIISTALCVHLSFNSSLSLFEEEVICSFSISLQDTVSILSLPLFHLLLFPLGTRTSMFSCVLPLSVVFLTQRTQEPQSARLSCHILHVFQEFDPPSEGQAGGHDHLLPNLEDSITLIEGSNQVTRPHTHISTQTHTDLRRLLRAG